MAEQNSNSADELMWVLGGVILLALLAWWALGAHVTWFFLELNSYKLALVEYFINPQPGDFLHQIRLWINYVSPADVAFSSLMELNVTVGRYYMVPVALLIFFWAYRLYALPTFSRKLSSRGMIESERKLWPEISVAMMHDIIHMDPLSGKWAGSTSPVELIEKYKLVDRTGQFNRERAKKLIINQLGKPFTGIKKLDKYDRALIGVFSAAICEDKKAALEALDEMNFSYNGSRIDPEPGIKLLDRYYDDPLVQDVVNRHYYISTMMYALLEKARQRSGVLPSCGFLWLKPLRRQRWYTLNNVGRKVAWAEVCAIYNHYLAEVVNGGGIEKPFIEKAVDGLEAISRNRIINF